MKFLLVNPTSSSWRTPARGATRGRHALGTFEKRRGFEERLACEAA